MWPKKLIWQLFLSYLLIMGVPIMIATWYSSLSFKKFYMTRTTEELKSRAWLLGSQVEDHFTHTPAANIDSLCKSLSKKVKTRFTVISPSGKVLGDSEKNPDSMENHLNRAEVTAAINGGIGVSIRYSHTLKVDMEYAALPVYSSGKLSAVVRTAIPVASVKTAVSDLFRKNIWGIFFMACLAAWVSYLISRKISMPLNAMTNGAMRFASGDFSTNLPLSGYQETRQLSVALNEMAWRLNDMITRITEQNHKLDAILSSMTEGVIAIDATMRIILVNNAAAKLFDSKRRGNRSVRFSAMRKSGNFL
jgi:two-component system phosphate regulon sensor histidine kinase PhoR